MLKFKLNPASLGDTMKQTDTTFEMDIQVDISKPTVQERLNLNDFLKDCLPGYVQMASTRSQNLFKRTTTLLYRKHTFADKFLYRTLFQVVHRAEGEIVFPTEPNGVLILTVTPGEHRLSSVIKVQMYYKRNAPHAIELIQLTKTLARKITAKFNEH
jgi:hypothetical protein